MKVIAFVKNKSCNSFIEWFYFIDLSQDLYMFLSFIECYFGIFNHVLPVIFFVYRFVGSVVYQGCNYTCKVNRLQEQTTYKFAILASNDAGSGPLSDVYEFKTAIAPPPSLKGEIMPCLISCKNAL